MKAISLKQPWANLIAYGVKTIETRKWKTTHRGQILICSSINVDKTFLSPWPDEPKGCVVAIAEIIDCRPMVKVDEIEAYCAMYPRAQSWVLQNIRRIHPLPIKGSLGVFECEYEPHDLVYID